MVNTRRGGEALVLQTGGPRRSARDRSETERMNCPAPVVKARQPLPPPPAKIAAQAPATPSARPSPSAAAKKRAPFAADLDNADLTDEWSGMASTCENVYAALESIVMPVNITRQNVKSSPTAVLNAMCLGLVHGRAHGMIASSYAIDRPNLTKFLTRFARESVPGFKFTSIQVNKNYQSAMHCDTNNLGPSYIVGVGNYTDGKLWAHGQGDLDCHDKWVQFDGNQPHCTLPYKKTRYTLIYFIQKSYNLMGAAFGRPNGQLARGSGPACLRYLKGFGFPMPRKGMRKAIYDDPATLRLKKAGKSFRAWRTYKKAGLEYTEGAEDKPSKTTSVEESSEEDEEDDCWAMTRRRRRPAAAGLSEPELSGRMLRRLARSGGTGLLADELLASKLAPGHELSTPKKKAKPAGAASDADEAVESWTRGGGGRRRRREEAMDGEAPTMRKLARTVGGARRAVLKV